LNFSSSGGEQLRKRFIELLNHCGGEHLVSAVRRRIIERVVFTEYQLDCLDLYLVELGPRIVNRRKRTSIPIVRERDALVSMLTKLYDQIGLDPTKPPIPTLAEYMRLRRKHGLTDEYYSSPTYRDMPRVYSRCSKLVTRAFAPTPCPLAIEFARMGRTHNGGEDNALDDATPDGRDKLLATAMVQQFEKTFPELLTAAGT